MSKVVETNRRIRQLLGLAPLAGIASRAKEETSEPDGRVDPQLRQGGLGPLTDPSPDSELVQTKQQCSKPSIPRERAQK